MPKSQILFGKTSYVATRVAESEEYDPTLTPKISKMPTPTPTPTLTLTTTMTPTPTPEFDSNSLVWAKYLS